MYAIVKSVDDIHHLLQQVNYFHDSLLREISVLSRGFVNEKLWMYGDSEPFDARLIFQMQNEIIPCIELIFEDILEIRLHPSALMEYGIRMDDNHFVMYQQDEKTNIIERDLIRSKYLRYRLLDRSLLGSELYLTEEIEENELPSALILSEDPNWIQCPLCQNTYAIRKKRRIVRCPKCLNKMIASYRNIYDR